MPNNEKSDGSGTHRICIVTPQKNVYSETFIRAHIENLPGQIYLLYGNGGAFPVYRDDETPLVSPPNFLRRAGRMILRELFQFDFSEQSLRKKGKLLLPTKPNFCKESRSCRTRRTKRRSCWLQSFGLKKIL